MYTLAIGNIVDVPLKFTLKDGRVNKTFAMTLTATRWSKEDMEARADSLSVRDFLLDVISGWSEQRLVLGADGQPAEFSRGALDALFDVGGVLDLTWKSYLRECAGKEKN